MLSPAEQLQQMGITLERMLEEAPEEPERCVFKKVERGPEFMRILSAARRPVPDLSSPEVAELAQFLTSRLATSSSPYPGPLNGAQAVCLRELWQSKGLFGALKVGAGKGLTAFLCPTILPTPRPLYVSLKSMLHPMQVEWMKYRQHWHGLPASRYRMISFEALSSPSAGEDLGPDGRVTRQSLLERLAPTMLIFDEMQRLASTGTTGCKRVDAYLEAHPETIVIGLSGTPFKTSIKDSAHILEWCLGRNAPLPNDYLEREMWASYLDAKKGMGPRASAGDLYEFLTPEEQIAARHALTYDVDAERAVVRKAISRRMYETPGFVGTQDPPLDVGLVVEAAYPTEDPSQECPKIAAAYETMRDKMELPDGTELMDQMQVTRHLSTIALGFWQKWEPQPPPEWVMARSAWGKWCRQAIKHNRRGIDSEARMKAAVRKGLYDDEGALAKWEEAEKAERKRTGLREPPSVSVWVSDEAIEYAAQWVKQYQGVVWVFHIGLGERIAARCGIPYYGQKSVDKRGVHITKHPGGPAVASIVSSGTGKNLQGFWAHNLWFTMPGEQSLGRTHRQGQKAAVVHNWIYLGCEVHLRSYYAANTLKSRFAEEMLTSPQRLRYADTDMPTMYELSLRGGERWQRASDD